MASYSEDVVDQDAWSPDAPARPVFDPTKLAKASAPTFDPAKLAAAKPRQAPTMGERMSRVWENPSPGGPVWMAKELVEGIRGAVDYSKRAADTPTEQTEADVYLQDRAKSDATVQGLRAAQFLTPSAPGGGLFAVPRTAMTPSKLVSPEATANRELADEFGFKLSRGQATRDLDQIRFEDMAARNAYGKDAQDRAAPFFQQQYDDIQSAGQQVGQTVARGEAPLGSPVNAGASLNREIADRSELMARSRDEVIARAEQAAAAERQRVADRGRALDEGIGQGREPVAPREAAEAVNAGVRGAAEQDRAFYQAKYEDVARRPGEFSTDAFQGVGSRIRNALFHHETDPVEITELTPAARVAMDALDAWSQPRIVNGADPKAGFADALTSITLKNVDTFMKRLSGYYKGAQTPEDRRAMRRVMGEFGNQVENAVADGLFTGDPEALTVLREAKGAFARYQRTYRPQQAGDDVGTALRRIVERDATPEETANLIIGSGRVGNAGLPVRLASRLEEILGAGSEEMQQVRQAMWQKASQVRNRAGEIDPLASANSIEAFANSTLGRTTFPQERTAMLAHARGVRSLDHIIESLPETAAAQRARTVYQQAFSGDHLSGSQRAVFRRMVDGSATPEETAQVMFSAIGSGNPGDAARALQAVGNIAGKDSPVMNTVRQGVWQRLTQEPFGKDQQGQQKMVQAINEFLNGKGGSVARQLYTEEERALMKRYAEAVRLTIIPKYARTNSDTAPALLAAAHKYAAAIGSALGNVVHGGVGGAAVTKAINYGVGKVGSSRNSRRLNDSLDDVIPKPVARPLAERRPALRNVPRIAPSIVSNALGGDSNPYQ